MTKTGITSAPFLRGRSGSGNIKAWRGKAGWKEAQALKTKFKKGKKKVSKTGDAFVAGATGAAVHGAATAELKKDKKSKNTKGRKRMYGGGRTNLLEELGRVEGESSNRNRRAEVSRIHGELNKGYKKGGRAAFKHGDWVQEPVPHADIKKYVERGTRKEDTRGNRVREEGSTLTMGKGRKAGRSESRKPKAGLSPRALQQPAKGAKKAKMIELFREGPRNEKFGLRVKRSLGGAATHGFNTKILRTD